MFSVTMKNAGNVLDSFKVCHISCDVIVKLKYGIEYEIFHKTTVVK